MSSLCFFRLLKIVGFLWNARLRAFNQAKPIHFSIVFVKAQSTKKRYRELYKYEKPSDILYIERVGLASKQAIKQCAKKGLFVLRLSKMAIKIRAYSTDGKREMTINEFKTWLKRFDGDKDGRISRDELADAIRVSSGGWFARRTSKRIVRSVDTDDNGFIDDNEIKRLAEFAEKHLNVRVLYL